MLFTGAVSTLITAVWPAVGGFGPWAGDAQLPGAGVGRFCEGQGAIIEAPASPTQHACLTPSRGQGIDPVI